MLRENTKYLRYKNESLALLLLIIPLSLAGCGELPSFSLLKSEIVSGHRAYISAGSPAAARSTSLSACMDDQKYSNKDDRAWCLLESLIDKAPVFQYQPQPLWMTWSPNMVGGMRNFDCKTLNHVTAPGLSETDELKAIPKESADSYTVSY